MDKKVVIGIVVIVLIILGIFFAIETKKQNELKEKMERNYAEKNKIATSYTYDFYEEKTFTSNGATLNFVVKKVGKDIEAGTYSMKANIGANPSFMIRISDIYQDNPNMLPRNL